MGPTRHIDSIQFDAISRSGLFDLIENGIIKDSSELYKFLNEESIRLLSVEYDSLAKALLGILKPGRILQIGCGLGNLIASLRPLTDDEIIGIDHSPICAYIAQNRFWELPKTSILQSCVFDFETEEKFRTILIINFWGIISYDNSAILCDRLKSFLAMDGKIIIGEVPNTIVKANTRNGGYFTIRYPFISNFSEFGYKQHEVELAEGKYWILTHQSFCESNSS